MNYIEITIIVNHLSITNNVIKLSKILMNYVGLKNLHGIEKTLNDIKACDMPFSLTKRTGFSTSSIREQIIVLLENAKLNATTRLDLTPNVSRIIIETIPTENEKYVEHAPVKKIPSDIEIAEKLSIQYQNAKKRKVDCTLSFKKMKQLMIREVCQITGIEFVDEVNHNYSKSIDRVDNSKGYHDNNVIVCIRIINEKKGSLSIKEIKQLYTLLKRRKLV